MLFSWMEEDGDAVFVGGEGEAGDGIGDLLSGVGGRHEVYGAEVGEVVYAVAFGGIAEDEGFGAGEADVAVVEIFLVPDAFSDGELGGALAAVDGTLVGFGEGDAPFAEGDVVVGFGVEEGAVGVEGFHGMSPKRDSR